MRAYFIIPKDEVTSEILAVCTVKDLELCRFSLDKTRVVIKYECEEDFIPSCLSDYVNFTHTVILSLLDTNDWRVEKVLD